MAKISWTTLEGTWLGLTEQMDEWPVGSRELACVVETRRLTEILMRLSGYEEAWRRLTSYHGEERE